MHAQALPEEAAVRWPLPPFFRLADGERSVGRACFVEFIDGRIQTAELLTFEPERSAVAVGVFGQAGAVQLDLDKVRMIKLRAPLALERNATAMQDAGVSEAAVHDEKSFLLGFRDGSKLSGRTRGFFRERAGLFLYLLGEHPKLTTSCFIPAQQLEGVQIGPLLGEALAQQDIVSGKALAAALGKQANLREEMLGKQLADRAIVSPADLARALQRQAQMPKLKLGDILVEAGTITRRQLEEALHIQTERRGRRLGDILIDMGAATSQQVQMALSDKLGVPYVNVRDFKIEPQALELVDANLATAQQVLPLLRSGDSLIVAVEDPLAMELPRELGSAAGVTIVPVIANPEDLRSRIAKEYAAFERAQGGDEAAQAAEPPESAKAPEERQRSRAGIEELSKALGKKSDAGGQPLAKDGEEESRVSENALVRLVNKIIVEAHAQGASDIHIEANPGNSPTRIRFRKDGDLEDYLELPASYRSALVSRLKIMAALDISEHRHGQDGKIDFSRFGPLHIELRVAIVPTSNGLEDVVLRILGGVEPLPIDKLGLAERDLAELKAMVARSYGLILVCGPTGSGKTTTLHSILHHINRPDIKIWTAEDPVEISQPGLRQVQINNRIDWTFAAAMRAFLRADPDVIMVGEMRDMETTKMGVEASLTGHLVFSTLHTNSAAETVVRLLELGMDPLNFADALIGILSQRLARKLCAKCKRARPASEREMTELAEEYCAGSKLEPAAVLAGWRSQYAREGQLLLHEAVGCEACSGGYRGRLGVYELLATNDRVKQAVRSRGSVPQIVEAAQSGGMRLLRQDAIEKVLGGQLDLGTARSASS